MKRPAYLLPFILALASTGGLFYQSSPPPQPASQAEEVRKTTPVIINPLNHLTATSSFTPHQTRAPQPARPVATPAGPATVSSGALAIATQLELPALPTEIVELFNRQPFPREILQQQPQAQPRPQLTYPEKALKRRISGRVTLSYLIDPSGQVTNLQVVDSQPAGYFEESALEYAAKWRFTPGYYQGQAVTVAARSTIEYQLP